MAKGTSGSGTRGGGVQFANASVQNDFQDLIVAGSNGLLTGGPANAATVSFSVLDSQGQSVPASIKVSQRANGTVTVQNATATGRGQTSNPNSTFRGPTNTDILSLIRDQIGVAGRAAAGQGVRRNARGSGVQAVVNRVQFGGTGG